MGWLIRTRLGLEWGSNNKNEITFIHILHSWGYFQRPSHQHYKAALHCLKYLYSTSEYGKYYHTNCASTFQAYNNLPHHYDKEAYNDTAPLSQSKYQSLIGAINLETMSQTASQSKYSNCASSLVTSYVPAAVPSHGLTRLNRSVLLWDQHCGHK